MKLLVFNAKSACLTKSKNWYRRPRHFALCDTLLLLRIIATSLLIYNFYFLQFCSALIYFWSINKSKSLVLYMFFSLYEENCFDQWFRQQRRVSTIDTFGKAKVSKPYRFINWIGSERYTAGKQTEYMQNYVTIWEIRERWEWRTLARYVIVMNR